MDYGKLRAQLEEFKRNRANEFKFAPIEKWMTKELGVERLPGKGGSHAYFKHPVLEQLNALGHFQIGLKKGKKIYRMNFLRYLYPVLKRIIDELEKEADREE